MALKEAMHEGHMVRKYTDKELPPDIVQKLNQRIADHNEKNNLAIKLMVNDGGAFHAFLKLILAKGVKNYFIMAGKESSDLDEKLGYSGADLMLYAQTLGLNTWWVGGTFSRKAVAEKAWGRKAVGVVAVGYGKSQGVPHKTKAADEVSEYDGEMPGWFRKGTEAALLAPTALAKQAFHIEVRENQVSFSCDNGIFSGVDTGLVKYHFELGAGKENFTWT